MPKLNIEFDTDTQELKVLVGDTQIENISCINLYNWDCGEGSPKFAFEVTTQEEVEGVKKMVRLTANESDGEADEKYVGLFASPFEKHEKIPISELISKGVSL